MGEEGGKENIQVNFRPFLRRGAKREEERGKKGAREDNEMKKTKASEYCSTSFKTSPLVKHRP